MEYERKGVTLIWQIDNVLDTFGVNANSPVIPIDVMEGTRWKLGIQKLPGIVHLTISKQEGYGPEEFGLIYDLTIQASHGIFRKRFCNHLFKMNDSYVRVSISTKYMDNHPPCLPLDTLTILCDMYSQRGSISKYCKIFVRTRLAAEHSTFRGMIEDFSGFPDNQKKCLRTVSSSTGQRLVTVNLVLRPRFTFMIDPFAGYTDSEGGTDLEIEFDYGIRNIADETIYKFKTFILDSGYGNTQMGKSLKEFRGSGRETLTLPGVTRELLLQNAALYLPNDTLNLHCELAYFSGIEYEKVESIEYETDPVDEVEHTDFSSGLLNSLIVKEGIPCDMQLQTATETFQAHTVILSARSPVFDAMFRSNMKESIQKLVHVDDIDAETVKRMLVFLYSNSCEELGWKDAMKLYVAADKYQILSLKGKCSALLKESVDFSNFCVLLHLADMHLDEGLKKAVHNYITRNLKVALHCDQWRNLEKNLPQLANEIPEKWRNESKWTE